MKDFKRLNDYNGYKFYEFNNGSISWSDNGGWLDCIFDSEDSAKYFIDLKLKFIDNFYNVVLEAQKIANINNDGYVSKEIIDKFELLNNSINN